MKDYRQHRRQLLEALLPTSELGQAYQNLPDFHLSINVMLDLIPKVVQLALEEGTEAQKRRVEAQLWLERYPQTPFIVEPESEEYHG